MKSAAILSINAIKIKKSAITTEPKIENAEINKTTVSLALLFLAIEFKNLVKKL